MKVMQCGRVHFNKANCSLGNRIVPIICVLCSLTLRCTFQIIIIIIIIIIIVLMISRLSVCS